MLKHKTEHQNWKPEWIQIGIEKGEENFNIHRKKGKKHFQTNFFQLKKNRSRNCCIPLSKKNGKCCDSNVASKSSYFSAQFSFLISFGICCAETLKLIKSKRKEEDEGKKTFIQANNNAFHLNKSQHTWECVWHGNGILNVSVPLLRAFSYGRIPLFPSTHTRTFFYCCCFHTPKSIPTFYSLPLHNVCIPNEIYLFSMWTFIFFSLFTYTWTILIL